MESIVWPSPSPLLHHARFRLDSPTTTPTQPGRCVRSLRPLRSVLFRGSSLDVFRLLCQFLSLPKLINQDYNHTRPPSCGARSGAHRTVPGTFPRVGGLVRMVMSI